MVRHLLSMILLVVMCLSFGSSVIQAQETALQGSELDEDEQAALEYVMQAMENMRKLETVGVTIEQNMQLTLDDQGISLGSDFYQISDGMFDYSSESINFSMTQVQRAATETNGQQEEAVEVALDVITVDNVWWLRLRETNPKRPGSLYPNDWTNVSENAAEMFYLEQLPKLMTIWQVYPLTTDSIASIEELDAEQLDNKEMRVFVVRYNSEGLLKIGAASQSGRMFNIIAAGDDVENWLPLFIEGTTIEMTMWIGKSDMLLYRAEVHEVVDMEVMGINPSMAMAKLQIDGNEHFNYHSFNEPLEITAPETGE